MVERKSQRMILSNSYQLGVHELCTLTRLSLSEKSLCKPVQSSNDHATTTYKPWWRHHLTVGMLTCPYVAEIDAESIKRRVCFLVNHQKLCLVLFALVLARDRVRRFTHSRCSSSLSLLCFVYAPSLEHKTPRRRVNMAQLLALVGGCVILLPQRSSTFYRPRDNLFLCWVCASQLGITSLTVSSSVQRGGRVEIIANDQGHRITPSWVGFNDEERLYVFLSL